MKKQIRRIFGAISNCLQWMFYELLSPLGLFFGGVIGAVASIFGLVTLLFPQTDPAIFSAEYIAKFIQMQPTLAFGFVILLCISVVMVIVGYLRGALEECC